jgi:hypothetical protein
MENILKENNWLRGIKLIKSDFSEDTEQLDIEYKIIGNEIAVSIRNRNIGMNLIKLC